MIKLIGLTLPDKRRETELTLASDALFSAKPAERSNA